MRACNKQLLGKLYADQLYLERLLVNPHFLNGRQNILALEQQLTKKKGDREGKYKDKESDPKDQEDPIQRKVFFPKLFPISKKKMYICNDIHQETTIIILFVSRFAYVLKKVWCF